RLAVLDLALDHQVLVLVAVDELVARVAEVLDALDAPEVRPVEAMEWFALVERERAGARKHNRRGGVPPGEHDHGDHDQRDHGAEEAEADRLRDAEEEPHDE